MRGREQVEAARSRAPPPPAPRRPRCGPRRANGTVAGSAARIAAVESGRSGMKSAAQEAGRRVEAHGLRPALDASVDDARSRRAARPRRCRRDPRRRRELEDALSAEALRPSRASAATSARPSPMPTSRGPAPAGWRCPCATRQPTARRSRPAPGEPLEERGHEAVRRAGRAAGRRPRPSTSHADPGPRRRLDGLDADGVGEVERQRQGVEARRRGWRSWRARRP